MRVTSCPDCGEVVEIPEKSQALEDVTCPTCGLSGPADEWRSYAPEDDESLLGRPLADATIPATVPRNWAIRIEQLEEIKDVMAELQHQVRLLRQALDELNDDLPDRVRRWMNSLQNQTPSPPADSIQPTGPAADSIGNVPNVEPTESRRRRASSRRLNQSSLW